MRSDPNYVFQSALQLNDGDKSPFIQSGLSNYLSIFPMQTGLVTFFRIYAFFSSSPKFIWFCQLMMIIGINYLLWKIANKAFQNRMLNNYVIIFSFLFLPSLFMIRNRPITRYLSNHSFLQYTDIKNKLEDFLCHSPSSH